MQTAVELIVFLTVLTAIATVISIAAEWCFSTREAGKTSCAESANPQSPIGIAAKMISEPKTEPLGPACVPSAVPTKTQTKRQGPRTEAGKPRISKAKESGKEAATQSPKTKVSPHADNFQSEPHRETEIRLVRIAEISREFDDYRDALGQNHYPPDWEARRKAIRERDKWCQVSGCLSLCPCDVHHRKAIAEGGSHRLENLVLLCAVHHRMIHEGHGFPEPYECARFGMIRAHLRNGRKVSAGFTRRENATVKDCESIREKYGMICPRCGHDAIHFRKQHDGIIWGCLWCGNAHKFPDRLPEEVGPFLALQLTVTKCSGRFPFSRSLLVLDMGAPVEICHACAQRATIGIFVQTHIRTGGTFMSCSNYWPDEYCKNTGDRQDARPLNFGRRYKPERDRENSLG